MCTIPGDRVELSPSSTRVLMTSVDPKHSQQTRNYYLIATAPAQSACEKLE